MTVPSPPASVTPTSFDTWVDAVTADTNTNTSGLAAHLADSSDAHDASAISIVDTGAYFTGTDVEAALQELGAGGGGGSQTPWTSNIDGDTFDLSDVGSIAIGTTAKSANVAALQIAGVDHTATATTSLVDFAGPTISGATNITNLTMINVSTGPVGSGFTGSVTNFYGMKFDPILGLGGAVTKATAVHAQIRTGSSTPVTTAVGVTSQVTTGFAAITTGVGVDVVSSDAGLTPGFTTMIGLRITSLGTGTTKWGMQVGDYQSYHHGKLTLGATTAPTYALDLLGTTADRAAIALTESATPTNPAQDAQAVMYVVSNKIVFAWNDGGTMRYKYLDLTGTGVTWVHSTTAP